MAAQSATPLLKVEGLKQYFKVNKNFRQGRGRCQL